MNDYVKKAAYLRGYISALSDEMSGAKGYEITNKLLDIIEEMAETLDKLTEKSALVDKLSGNVADLTERLDDLELFGLDDIDDEELDELDDDDADELDFDDEELEESDLFEIQCTECGDDFTIDYDDIMGDEAIRCPHCGARIELAIDFGDEDGEEWDF